PPVSRSSERSRSARFSMRIAMVISSVIVHQLSVLGIRPSPLETQPELIVDPDAVLPCPIPLQGFQSIARQNPQVVQPTGAMQDRQIDPRPLPEFMRQSLDRQAKKQGRRALVAERLDRHREDTIITR